jgi:hypothetical protein
VVSGTDSVPHNHRVDEVPARQTSPGTHVIGVSTLDDIHPIEGIDGVHETMTPATGQRIHGAASLSTIMAQALFLFRRFAIV